MNIKIVNFFLVFKIFRTLLHQFLIQLTLNVLFFLLRVLQFSEDNRILRNNCFLIHNLISTVLDLLRYTLPVSSSGSFVNHPNVCLKLFLKKRFVAQINHFGLQMTLLFLLQNLLQYSLRVYYDDVFAKVTYQLSLKFIHTITKIV